MEKSEPSTHFTEHAEFTGVTANDRAGWLKLRREMVTASDFAALLGQDPHRTALDVYVDKLRPAPSEVDPLHISDPRFWGIALEQTILLRVARYYGWRYQRGGLLLRSRKHPFIGTTLDSEIDRNDGQGWIPFECKNSEIHRNWDEATEECPIHVAVQCQVQALVTGAPLTLCFALLSRYRPVQIPIEPNEDFHRVLVEVGEEFLSQLARLEPPPPTAASGRALQRLYPAGDGTIVELPREAVEWTRELHQIAGTMATLEGRSEELRNLLRASIGTATFGTLPEEVDGKRAWRWHLQRRPGHVVAPSESRVLMLLKDATLPAPKKPPARKPAQLPEPQPALDLASALEASIAENERAKAPRKKRARKQGSRT